MTSEKKIEDKNPDASELKSVLLHNFDKREISLILRAIKQLYTPEARKKIVFAMTTEQSLQMRVDEWIEDTAGDHLYLLENPPSSEQHAEVLKNDREDTKNERDT